MRENTFQNILDDNTAYWLGFLTADGSISKTTIQIGLANKDKEHLEKLRNFLEVDKPINDRYDWSLNLLQDKRSKQTYSFQTESNVKLTQFLNDYCGMAEWCKFYGLPYQTAIIKKMTDEEWEKA